MRAAAGRPGSHRTVPHRLCASDRLHFEFTREGRTESISVSVTDPVALLDALAGPTGISLGAAHTIPALLLPESNQDSWSLLQLKDVHLIAPPPSQGAGWVLDLAHGDWMGWSAEASRC